MPNHYHKSSLPPSAQDAPHILLSVISAFLSACRKPAVVDFGDTPLHLLPGDYALECRSGRVVLDAWNSERSLSRRILDIQKSSPGVLDCTTQRFGGAKGSLTFLDLERPQTLARSQRSLRQNFAEQFRRILGRQFPSWEIRSLTAAPDLRRSFSSLFPRAHLSLGSRHIAALACPSAETEPELITFALLWFDHLRSRLKPNESLSLCLFLPSPSGNLTAHRLRWLSNEKLSPRLYHFNEHGMAGEVDPADLGNLDTRLLKSGHASELSPLLRHLVAELNGVEGVGCASDSAGLSVRFRGLEFARLEGDRALLGIENRESVALGDLEKITSFATHLASLSRGGSAMLGGELASFPERHFETMVRANLPVLDPELLLTPIHGQVLTFAGGERQLIDLLAVSAAGRLSILELKTAEDLHLPIQGLDYWMRVRWHLERGELSHLFPSIPLLPAAPKLSLVAPALSFHPSNQIVLCYFAPEIQIERIGVNSEWESRLQVAFRLRGADVPISHQRNR